MCVLTKLRFKVADFRFHCACFLRDLEKYSVFVPRIFFNTTDKSKQNTEKYFDRLRKVWFFKNNFSVVR